jgi:hypothetical protein
VDAAELNRPGEASLDDLCDAPERIGRLSPKDLFAIPQADQAAIQLQGARKRFAELSEQIHIVNRLAKEQGLSEITCLQDLGHMLIPHAVLKSYPISIIENQQFDRLTRWIDGFTTYDLSGLDTSSCQSIDDWIELLEVQTEIRIAHSTGTSGKLSLLPAGRPEMIAMSEAWIQMISPYPGETPWLSAPPTQAPLLSAQHRFGAQMMIRSVQAQEEHARKGDASRILWAYPGRFSADVASIGGRLMAAESRGELGRSGLSADLLRRRDKFAEDVRQRERHLDEFFEAMVAQYRGEAVVMIANVPTLFRLAEAGLKRGLEGVFAPLSFVQGGGGLKGQVLPDDWQDTIARFTGGARAAPGYGMSEAFGSFRICPAGHYHLPAWFIPFICDPVSGEQAPRTGVQTGRMAFFDLKAQSLWGGSITGDEVTLTFGDEETCACGRQGSFVAADIRRYAEKDGGLDKITCSGAPEAHDRALDFILQTAGEG